MRAEPLKFAAEGVKAVVRDIFLPWFNAYRFLIQNITSNQVPFYFGGTSLLIVVGVALDTMRQMEAQLLMRHYEGFLK